jgi:hypothetical protein
MTAKELLAHQIDEAGFQLKMTFEGLSEEGFDHHACGSSMSPREMIEHLAEACQATIETAAGREYEWGSFSIEDKTGANLVAVWADLREKASAAVLAGESEGSFKSGSAFLVEHDFYHVGQMATVRLSLDPDWNAYCIYR